MASQATLEGSPFTRLGLRPDGVPVRFGSLLFSASKRAPAKWACIGPSTEDAEIDALVQCMLHTWRMPQPRVIISVIGAETTAELEAMGAQRQLVVSR